MSPRAGQGVAKATGLASYLLTLLLTAVLLGLAGCGSQTASDSQDPAGGSALQSSSAAEPRLWIKEKGGPVPFENGRSLSVDGMDVEIFVSPYPPGRTANVDFFVTRDGLPVEGANVTLQYDMTVMEHGPFQLLAVPTGSGHFLAPLDFAMSGDFWINVSVSTPTRDSVINLLMRATR